MLRRVLLSVLATSPLVSACAQHPHQDGAEGTAARVAASNPLPGGTPTGPPVVKNYAEFPGRAELSPVVVPPAALGLDPFYRKYVDAGGIPIVASEKVRDDALLLARDIVNGMLQKRGDIREGLIKRGARVAIMAISEGETDLPERRGMKKPAIDDRRLVPRERETYNSPGGIGQMTDKQYWDNRARGMGGTVTSCAEENLLGIPGTRYYGEHITIHEFSHNMMSVLQATDPAWIARLRSAYEAAKAQGLYRDAQGREQYAINTVAEYFAEGTQWWFWSNFEFYDGRTRQRVQSPEDMKAYDPALYGILEEVYAGHHIPADIYHGKNLRPAR